MFRRVHEHNVLHIFLRSLLVAWTFFKGPVNPVIHKSPPRLAALIECGPPVGNDDDLPGSWRITWPAFCVATRQELEWTHEAQYPVALYVKSGNFRLQASCYVQTEEVERSFWSPANEHRG